MRALPDHAGWDRGILFCTYDLLISGEGGKAAAARKRAAAAAASSRATAAAGGLKGAAATPAAGGITPPPLGGGGTTPGIGGMTPGMTPGVTPGMTPGVTPGMTPGLTPGLTPEPTPGQQQQQEGEGEDGADGEFGKMLWVKEASEGWRYRYSRQENSARVGVWWVPSAEHTRRPKISTRDPLLCHFCPPTPHPRRGLPAVPAGRVVRGTLLRRRHRAG